MVMAVSVRECNLLISAYGMASYSHLRRLPHITAGSAYLRYVRYAPQDKANTVFKTMLVD
jgi:hypothetical protein